MRPVPVGKKLIGVALRAQVFRLLEFGAYGAYRVKYGDVFAGEFAICVGVVSALRLIWGEKMEE